MNLNKQGNFRRNETSQGLKGVQINGGLSWKGTDSMCICNVSLELKFYLYYFWSLVKTCEDGVLFVYALFFFFFFFVIMKRCGEKCFVENKED